MTTTSKNTFNFKEWEGLVSLNFEEFNGKMDGMSIQKQVEFHMKLAMKLKQKKIRDLLRVVMGEFAREGKEITDEQALKIIKKMYDNAPIIKCKCGCGKKTKAKDK